jgi:serine/threonine protein kinase
MSEHELMCARQEKQIMGELDHHNIIGLIESYEDDYCLYLVMNMMADDVRNVMINCDQAFDENTAKTLFYQMCDAVNYCHKRGIVHRDVKLENFFLDFEESKQITVKLGDFGIAKEGNKGKNI